MCFILAQLKVIGLLYWTSFAPEINTTGLVPKPRAM